MGSERDTFVLVPDAARSALLADGGKLPCVSSPPGAAGVMDALRRLYLLDPPYLRPVKLLWDAAKEQAGAELHEFDAPDADWKPPRGMEWLPLAGADPALLSPPGLAPDVEKWLAIARGAAVPETRPPWARPGWLAAASAWLEASMVEAGLEPEGQAEVVEQWPLSSVLEVSFDVTLGEVFEVACDAWRIELGREALEHGDVRANNFERFAFVRPDQDAGGVDEQEGYRWPARLIHCARGWDRQVGTRARNQLSGAPCFVVLA